MFGKPVGGHERGARGERFDDFCWSFTHGKVLKGDEPFVEAAVN